MIHSGKGMGNSEVRAVGVRRELHVLLLRRFSPLLVEAEQVCDGIAEDEGPNRQGETEELHHAEGEVRRQKAADEQGPISPPDQWSKDNHRRLAPEAIFLGRAPQEDHRRHWRSYKDAAQASNDGVELILEGR